MKEEWMLGSAKEAKANIWLNQNNNKNLNIRISMQKQLIHIKREEDTPTVTVQFACQFEPHSAWTFDQTLFWK